MTTPEAPEPSYPPAAPAAKDRLKQALAPVIAVGAAVAKFGAVLFKLKAFTLVFSTIATLAIYSAAFGWQFALGFVVLLLIHESGHVVVLRARGIPASWPVLIPFLGAFVKMEGAPKSVYDEAVSAIAGPVFGVAGAFGALGLAEVYDSNLLRAIAYFGFYLNLFNLLPFLPLDGGRTAAAISPKLWFVGLALLLGYEVYRPSPIIPILLLLGGLEGYRRWKARNTPASLQYNGLTPQQRLNVGGAYVLLIVTILWAMHSYPLPPRPV